MGDKLDPGTKNFQCGSIVVGETRPTRCKNENMRKCTATYVIVGLHLVSGQSLLLTRKHVKTNQESFIHDGNISERSKMLG